MSRHTEGHRTPESPEEKFAVFVGIMSNARTAYYNYFPTGCHFRFSAIFPNLELAKQARKELSSQLGLVFDPDVQPPDPHIVAGSIYDFGPEMNELPRGRAPRYPVAPTDLVE